ncbi:MAG: hypothetical protein HY876_08395 [Coriobacteriales bacterium]|nr:hypothetical protein [Coriobacteriales bacterium]
MRSILTVAMVCALVAPTMASAASIGAGTDTGRITIEEPLTPGSSKQLPTITIFNTGDVAATYVMRVAPVEGVRTPEASWFTFSPASATIPPHSSMTFDTRVDVPASAVAGDYGALLLGTSDRQVPSSSGALLNVAAGPRLTVSVARGNPLVIGWGLVVGFFARYAPWSYAGLLALAGIFAAIGLGLLPNRRREDSGPSPQGDLT